jgi:hypothetical protein
LDVKASKEIGGNTYHIRPFAAFTAANISGELAAVITPLLASIAPAVAGGEEDASLLDIDTEQAAPALSAAFSALSGDKVESLLKKLLTKHGNISVETDGELKQLDDNLVNELFCGEVQDVFVLAFEVVKVNFGGFFKKLGSLSGNLIGGLPSATT